MAIQKGDYVFLSGENYLDDYEEWWNDQDFWIEYYGKDWRERLKAESFPVVSTQVDMVEIQIGDEASLFMLDFMVEKDAERSKQAKIKRENERREQAGQMKLWE